MIVDKLFLVCGMPRSGSNLFLSLLDSTDLLGPVEEYFGRKFLSCYLSVPYDDRLQLSDSEVCSVFDKVVSDTHRNGVWGSKVFLDQLNFIQRYVQIMGLEWGSFKIIWLRRRDILKQSISFAKATTLQRFMAKEDVEADEDIDVSMSSVVNFFKRLAFCELAWKHFFDAYDVVPHVVFYEDFEFESGWASVIESVLDFLEVRYERPLCLSTNLRKQFSDWNFQVYEEFLRKILIRESVLYLPPSTNLLK